MSFNLMQLLRNIKYLGSVSLQDKGDDLIYQTLIRVDDFYHYELTDPEYYLDKYDFKILNYDETVNTLLNHPMSFCRFGDGEIDLIHGQSIPFQQYDKKLVAIMKNILSTNIPNMYVGINYNYFHSTKNMTEQTRRYYLVAAKKYRDWLNENACKDRTYIAAGFNATYVSFTNFDFDSYYIKLKNLFKDRDIVVFVGKNILSKLQYDIFEDAKSKTIEQGPRLNAFSVYNEVLNKARQYGKDRTLCFILGPASKALVYQLTLEGYMAWDIGHMAKDYDAYMNKINKNPENIIKFFSPD